MKMRLTINSGTLAGQVYELESGFLTIGRGENCSIRFDPISERIASKQHAFIDVRPDGFYINDNKSLNGTFLNGERIQRMKIKTGDLIQFGRNGVTASVWVDNTPVADLGAVQLEHIQQAASANEDNFQKSMMNVGLGQLEAVPEPSRTGRYVGIGFTIFAIVFMAIIVVAIMVLSLGPVAAVIATVVAFVPAVLYLFPLLWLDRYDPEPLWLLALAFAWGALVAVIFSIFVNSIIAGVVEVNYGPDAAQIAGGVFSAPVFEEASKGLGLVVLLVFFRRYFDDILDGIVFAGVIALGFATVENVQYYGSALVEGGFGALMVLFVMRGVLSPFAHVTFTAMTGIGCGIARESHNVFIRILAPLAGYCAAVFLHGLWNGMAIVGGFGSFLLGYLVIEIPFFLIFVGFSAYIMRRQNRILKEMLAFDVARGLIPKEHADIAVSAFKSSGWLLGGFFSGKFRARSKYLRAIGKLGLSYWHIQRATAAQGQTGSFQQNPIIKKEVLKWREQV